ncbi:MAG: iron-containing alcohol dehydrogenase, partial [Candidatus Aenigmarchaeota archaeon]|nr:iron-containing alcohol dehydrogenase [Candidatus Aenigmarchaeota archaeon]
MMMKEFFSKLKDERSLGDVLKSKGMSLKFVSNKSQLKKEISPFHNGTLITGKQFTEKYSRQLGKFKNKFSVKNESFSEVYRIMKKAKGDFIIGFGGGRVLDVSKMVSYQTGRKLILMPSAPTHDGLV